MNQVLAICYLPFFIIGFNAAFLPDKRKVCTTEEITFVPDEYEYYEEPIELSFDSGMSLNHVLVTRILEEECGLRDRVLHSFLRREKRSHIARGIFRLSKWFLHFYEKSKKILKPELLKGIKNVVARLNHIKTPIGKAKFAGIGKFFYEMWKDVERVREEANDEHFDLMLEQIFRTSLQLLINNGELSEILLNNPIILERIKRRIPSSNGKLLSAVTATNIKCHPNHRDSQVVIHLKLKIPKVSNMTIEKCDDIGTMTGNSYQFYNIPSATFRGNNTIFKVDIGKCVLENFVFCPFDSISETACSKENLDECVLKESAEKTNFVRELHSGFAVYGDFTQVISTKDGMHNQWTVDPRHLYHVIPQSGAIVSIGSNELKQFSQSDKTEIRKVEQ